MLQEGKRKVNGEEKKHNKYTNSNINNYNTNHNNVNIKDNNEPAIQIQPAIQKIELREQVESKFNFPQYNSKSNIPTSNNNNNNNNMAGIPIYHIYHSQT